MWSTVCDLISLKATKDTVQGDNYIFDFNKYKAMIVESENGEEIARIEQDEITLADGYKVRLIPTEIEA